MYLRAIKTAAVSLILLSVIAMNAQENKTVKVLSALEFEKAIDADSIQLVDVRTSKEFEEGAIGNASNIDYFQEELFTAQFLKLDKTKPVYLYCRSGNRSSKAAMRLQKMGFEKIFDLEGGYQAWQERIQEN